MSVMKNVLWVALLLLFFVNHGSSFNIAVTKNAVTTIKIGTSNENLTSFYPGKQLAFSRNGSNISIFLGAPPASGPIGNGSVWRCSANLTDSPQGAWITTPECKSVLSRGNLPDERANHLLGGGSFGGTLFSLAPDQYMTCATRRVSQCGTVFATPGACYRGQIPSPMKWVDWKQESCFTRRFDILFLVDSSNSISTEEFVSVKAVLLAATEEFKRLIGVNTQIEILQYGQLDGRNLTYLSSSERHYTIPVAFGQCLSLKCLQEGINNMKHLRAANTYTARAIERAAKINFPKSRFAGVATKFLILITDGVATDYKLLGQSYTLTKSNDITVYAVGVGTKVNLGQLRTSANGGSGGNLRVVTTDSFEKLQEPLRRLASGIVNISAEGPVGRPSESEMIDTLFGFSGHKTKENQLIMGAVGAYKCFGTVAKFETTTSAQPTILSFQKVSKLLPTNAAQGLDSYLGYDITSGNFNGGNTTYVATSAPKYLWHGAVVVFNQATFPSNMENYTILPISCNKCTNDHRQCGSFYGGALLSVDVNGDGADDLLVGAPLFVGDNYDEGRVFVYLSLAKDTLSTWSNTSGYVPTALWGEKNVSGRFGSSMTSAGDVNNDGYNDVIIAAPMAGSGKGVIYLYHGGPDGLTNVIKQKITASSLFDQSIRSFGFSVLGNVDVNGNQLPDVIVSSPTSDRLTILRTRPIVNFKTTFEFANSSLQIIQCLRDKESPCLILQPCFSYDGKSVENKLDIELDIYIDAELKRLDIQYPGIMKVRPGVIKLNVTLVKHNQTCIDLDIRPLTQSITDLDKLVVANLTYSLPESYRVLPVSSVELPGTNHDFSATAVFDKSCGDFCQYDLSVTGNLELPSVFSTSVPTLVVASDDTIKVKLNITHQGDSAYGTYVKVSYSSTLKWSKIINFSSHDPDHPICVRLAASTQSTAQNNPLRIQTLTYDDADTKSIMMNNSWCYFEVVFSYKTLKESGLVPEVEVKILLDTTISEKSSLELDDSDNTINITIPIKYRSSVSLRTSGESAIPFNFTNEPSTISSIYNVGQNTTNVIIGAEVRGTGFSNIPKSNISIMFPSELNRSRPLLYPYRVQCTTTGTASCTCSKSNLDPNRFLQTQNSSVNFTSTPNPNFLQLPSYECGSNLTSSEFTCDKLECEVGNLGENETVNVRATFRIWTQTLRLRTDQDDVKLISEVKYSAQASPLIMDEAGKTMSPLRLKLSTTALRYVAPPSPPAQPFPWWGYVLIICPPCFFIGLGILLHKFGGFENEYSQQLKDLKWQDAETEHQNNVYESEIPENAAKVYENEPPENTKKPKANVFKMDSLDNTYVNEESQQSYKFNN